MYMKKIAMLLLFVSSLASISANTTKIGLFTGYPTTGLTFSIDKVEGHLGFYYDMENSRSNSLYISGDYKFLDKEWTLGSTSGFFWNVAAGPFLSLTSNYLGFGVLAPAEFGYNIPKLLDNRFDVYLQLSIGSHIIPRPDLVWGLGLGLRIKL